MCKRHSLEYRATGGGIESAAVMKLFESEYKENMTADEAIDLGLRALHTATEGKFDVNTVEIGIAGSYSSKKRTSKKVEAPVGSETAVLPFRKLNAEEVKAAVTKFSKAHAADKVTEA